MTMPLVQQLTGAVFEGLHIAVAGPGETYQGRIDPCLDDAIKTRQIAHCGKKWPPAPQCPEGHPRAIEGGRDRRTCLNYSFTGDQPPPRNRSQVNPWKLLPEYWRAYRANLSIRACGVYCGIESTYGNHPGRSRYEAAAGDRPSRASDEAEPLRVDSRRSSRAPPEFGNPSVGGARQQGLCEAA